MENITIELVSKMNANEIFLFEVANREYFEQTLPSRGEKYYEIDYFLKLIDSIIKEQEQGLCYMYLIRNESNSVVGRVNIVSIVRKDDNKAEIGYRISEKYQGRGYGTEAIKLAIGEAFEVYDIERIEAGTSPKNKSSQRILLKNGFEFIKKEFKTIEVNGKWEDSLIFEKVR